MNPTVTGALIAGTSIVATTLWGEVRTSRRDRERLQQARLHGLAAIVDQAQSAVTAMETALAKGGEHAQEAGADPGREVAGAAAKAKARMDRRQRVLWEHEDRLRLRVPDGHPLLEAFSAITRETNLAITATEDLIRGTAFSRQRDDLWRQRREHGRTIDAAKLDFQAAAREIMGPVLETDAPSPRPQRALGEGNFIINRRSAPRC